MKRSKMMAVLFALVLALGAVACGDTEDDGNNSDNGNDTNESEENSDDPTVTESEYIDACVEHADTCESAQGDESDCEDLWNADMDGASNSGACVDARVEGWGCMVDHECGDESGCQEIFSDIGSYCTPE